MNKFKNYALNNYYHLLSLFGYLRFSIVEFKMVIQTLDRMTLLSLVEASQSAVESSDLALKAAEKALSAAQTANNQAKDVLKAVSEAFVQEDRKMMTNSEGEREPENEISRPTSSMSCENDSDSLDMENFVILSTNNNPVKDVDEDIDEDSKFFLISSTGAAADHRCNALGHYRRCGQSEDGRSVNIQEEDEKPEIEGCNRFLFHFEGVWVVASMQSMHLKAATPSESPSSVKWQYYDQDLNLWKDDQTLTVTSLSERPTCDCEVTIRLSANIARDIGDPGVSGVYRPTGTYFEGRPVMKQYEGLFLLYVYCGRWRLGTSFGNGEHLCSRTVPSSCPADPRAAIDQTRGLKYWGLMTKRSGGWIKLNEFGLSVTCSKHKKYK